MVDIYAISAVILFGSQATNRSDEYSDLDVCIILKDYAQSDHEQFKEVLKIKWNIDTNDYVIYSQNQIREMIDYGSLFMWHLKLEGKVIYDNGFFVKAIRALRHYHHHSEEIEYHSQILSDMINAFNKFQTVNELDLSLLFTIFRNTCMILCHSKGVFAFGRNNVFVKAQELYPVLPINIETYQNLSIWKFIYEREFDISNTLPDPNEFVAIIEEARKILTYARENVPTSDN